MAVEFEEENNLGNLATMHPAQNGENTGWIIKLLLKSELVQSTKQASLLLLIVTIIALLLSMIILVYIVFG